MSLKPIKKALQLKPPRTRSRTEMSCPEAGVSQGPDEIAESEAEAISREVNETRSPGNDNGVLGTIEPSTTEDNTKRINELTKLVENSTKLMNNKFDTILKAIALQNSQSLDITADTQVSTVNNLNSHFNSTDSGRMATAITTDALSTTPTTKIQTPILLSSHASKSCTLPINYNSNSSVEQLHEGSSSQPQDNNIKISQLQKQIDNLQKSINQNPTNKNISIQPNTNHIFSNNDPAPRNQHFQQTINSRLSNNISDKAFRKISGEKPREELNLFELQCKNQGIFDDQSQFEIIIGIWPINDVLSYVRAGKPSSYMCFKEEILSMTPCLPDIHKPPPTWSTTPTFKDVHQLVSKGLTCSQDDLYKHLTLIYCPKWASNILRNDLELPLEKFKGKVMWTLEQGPTELKTNYNGSRPNYQHNFNDKFKNTFKQNQNFSNYNTNRFNQTQNYKQNLNQFVNKNINRCSYHTRFGEKSNNCEGQSCDMYQKFLEKKLNFLKNKPAAVNMSIIKNISNENTNGDIAQGEPKNIDKVNTYVTTDANKEEIKQEINKKCDTMINNELPCEIKQKSLTELLIIADNETAIQYLLDTGAEVSIIPKSMVDIYEKDKSAPNIYDINGKISKALGYVIKDVKIGLKPDLPHPFYVIDTDIPFAILGLDFIVKNKLTIVPQEKTIAQVETGVKLKLKQFTGPVNKTKTTEEVENLLNLFPEIDKEPNYKEKPKHGHVLDIKLDKEFSPRHQKARKTNAVVSKEIEDNFNKLLKQGAVIRGSSEVVSPLTVVRKKNGKPRVCVDYQYINQYTKIMSYPLPNIDDLSSIIPIDSKIFSTLDLKEAYLNLPLTYRAQKIAAMISQYGTFLPLRTSFGLKNAPMAFQRLMDDIMAPCHDFSFTYIDDIIIYSKSMEEHMQHLFEVLFTLNKFGLHINREKCKFAAKEVQYLGHILSSKGFYMQQNKVEAIENFQNPKTIKQLRSFLGCLNYYNKFAPKLAEILQPLYELTIGESKNSRKKLNWETKHQVAFEKSIQTLVSATHLSYEDPKKELVLSTDASSTHVGAVLEQKNDLGIHKPLAFFSKKLPVLKSVRSVFFRELTGLYLSIKHFKVRIIGRQLRVRTDHLALVNAINNATGNHSPKEEKYIAIIKEYAPIMEFIPGTKNTTADLLSRPVLVAYNTNILEENEENTKIVEINDDTINSYIDHDSEEELVPNESESNLKVPLNVQIISKMQSLTEIQLPHLVSDYQTSQNPIRFESRLIDNCEVQGILEIKTNNFRIWIPPNLKSSVLKRSHNTLHQGYERTLAAVGSNFWWPKMKEDVKFFVKTCITCQKVKVTRYNRPMMGCYPKAIGIFDYIHADLVGPLVESQGMKYILTIKERCTGLFASCPLPNKEAETVKNAFLQNWVGHYGIPCTIVTDNGKEFLNHHFETMCSDLSIKHSLTPPYHPETNGMVERQHRELKTALRSLRNKLNWVQHLPIITLTLNNQSIGRKGFSPAQYTFGTPLNIPGKLFFPKTNTFELPSLFETEIFIKNMKEFTREWRNPDEATTYIENHLFKAEQVLVKNHTRHSLDHLYKGPYNVIERGPHSFIIDQGTELKKVAIKNLKAYFARYPTASNDRSENTNYNLRSGNKLKPNTKFSMMGHNNIAGIQRPFIRDRYNGMPYLVDSGSDVSIMPAHLAKYIDYTKINEIQGFSGQIFRALGTTQAEVNINIPGLNLHEFIVIPNGQTFAILGLDFINRWNIAIITWSNAIFHVPNIGQPIRIEIEKSYIKPLDTFKIQEKPLDLRKNHFNDKNQPTTPNIRESIEKTFETTKIKKHRGTHKYTRNHITSKIHKEIYQKDRKPENNGLIHRQENLMQNFRFESNTNFNSNKIPSLNHHLNQNTSQNTKLSLKNHITSKFQKEIYRKYLTPENNGLIHKQEDLMRSFRFESNTNFYANRKSSLKQLLNQNTTQNTKLSLATNETKHPAVFSRKNDVN